MWFLRSNDISFGIWGLLFPDSDKEVWLQQTADGHCRDLKRNTGDDDIIPCLLQPLICTPAAATTLLPAACRSNDPISHPMKIHANSRG